MKTGSGYLLLVEDDPDILKLLHTTLTFRGYRVVTARNGREGLDIVREEHPSIVIADIMMPKLDGFGLVHRLRLSPETCNIPVVFITATYVAPEDKEFALNIGATRFLQKPVDLDAFLKTIDELLTDSQPATIEPMREFNFYEGYRQRLEIKLDQKNRQIARDEYLLKTHPSDENDSLKISLRHAIAERDELKLLLEQVQEQMEKYSGQAGNDP
ncbi:MAG TPA: response regulator [Anaerolineales bacterium]|nr:response regulator [Anaerolineales bacterium]